MQTGFLLATFSNLVARTQVDEVGPGDANTTSDAPVDQFGGNPAPPKMIPKNDQLPDQSLQLGEAGVGTIEDEGLGSSS
jgi:hypothetical protein